MSDILITNPIYFTVDVIENDDKLPSLKLTCRIKNEGLKGDFDIRFNFWVSCSDWDLFATGKSRELSDLSNFSRIEIISDNSDLYFVINPVFSTFNVSLNSELKIKISENDLNCILNQFLNYPKWW